MVVALPKIPISMHERGAIEYLDGQA